MQKWHSRSIGLLAIIFIVGVVSVSAQELTPVPNQVADDIVDLTVDTAESTANWLETLVNRLTMTPQSELARILMVIGGIVLLVAGWRIYDFIVIIAGILIGASIAVALVNTDSTLLNIAALLIGGFIGAFLSAFVYYAAVFLIGAYIGILLTHAFLTALNTPPAAILLLVGAIIGGLVLIGLSFEFLVLVSSLVGAQLLSLGLGLGVIWTLVFTILGIVIQFGLMRSFQYDFRRRRRPISTFQWRRV